MTRNVPFATTSFSGLSIHNFETPFCGNQVHHLKINSGVKDVELNEEIQ